MSHRRPPVSGVRPQGRIGTDGWHTRAVQRRSPHADARPAGVRVELIVIHAISLPPGRFATDAVEQLFMGTLDAQSHPALASLQGVRVSAHFFIRRSGALMQFVPVHERAWHAGASRYRGRARCNDHSVGIELDGDGRRRFTAVQYRALSGLIRSLASRLPVRDVAGHSHIAPGRKRDPGPLFDWQRVFRISQRCGLRWPLTPAGRVIARRA
ncbi:MAG: 1,6-anhydro-N-acetylmuramyl-L-alanine amidase AmpD [Burkholderiales bacterium]